MKENNGRFFQKINDNVISLSGDSLVVNGTEVIKKIDSRFVVQPGNSARLGDRHNAECDGISTFRERLVNIARLLNEGRQLEAAFIAGSTNWGADFQDSKARKANFNPLEPRQSGEWARESSASQIPASIVDVQYRGYFHDIVVDDLLEGLKSRGSIVLKNVRVLGLNAILAIPDGASLPNGRILPYFIEVKTGNDPGFTTNQNQVYPLICTGGHATSFDPRISQLGRVDEVPDPQSDGSDKNKAEVAVCGLVVSGG